jgi:hypothetical protein
MSPIITTPDHGEEGYGGCDAHGDCVGAVDGVEIRDGDGDGNYVANVCDTV